jgi:hypothetical protein
MSRQPFVIRTAPANLNFLPREYQSLSRGGSRPRDKFDDMYKRRVIAGQVPGDEELRKQKRQQEEGFRRSPSTL